MFAPEREYLAEILKDAGDDKFESEHFFPKPDYEKINNYFDKIDAWIKERRLDKADNFHRIRFAACFLLPSILLRKYERQSRWKAMHDEHKQTFDGWRIQLEMGGAPQSRLDAIAHSLKIMNGKMTGPWKLVEIPLYLLFIELERLAKQMSLTGTPGYTQYVATVLALFDAFDFDWGYKKTRAAQISHLNTIYSDLFKDPLGLDLLDFMPA